MVAYAREKKSPQKKSGKADRKPKQKRTATQDKTNHARAGKKNEDMTKKKARTRGKKKSGDKCEKTTRNTEI